MRIWKYELSEYDEESINSSVFDGGYVNAPTIKRAMAKVNKHARKAWGDKIKLMITLLEFEHEVNIE